MHAYKLNISIPEDRLVRLPEELPVGPAELIVLVSPTPAAEPSNADALLRVLGELRARHRPTRSKEEIDRELQAERDSWDDGP
ncbi:hypothetical protein [Sorangium sp. So ce1151]|uniref:hypothetical protein n=1 Tax=Sorangium sp. So ce1151 TaxID=3133332 RepID=UPI003F6252BA